MITLEYFIKKLNEDIASKNDFAEMVDCSIKLTKNCKKRDSLTDVDIENLAIIVENAMLTDKYEFLSLTDENQKEFINAILFASNMIDKYANICCGKFKEYQEEYNNKYKEIESKKLEDISKEELIDYIKNKWN